MKVIKNKHGFTLIEILVAINISAISISLIISFYLFTVKFLNESLFKYENNWRYQNFFYLLGRTLRKSTTYNFRVDNGSLLLSTSNQDSLFINSSSISLNYIYELKKLTDISIVILINNQTEFKFVNGKTIVNNVQSYTTDNTFKFDEIDILVSNKSGNFPFRFLTPQLSVSKFKDIDAD